MYSALIKDLRRYPVPRYVRSIEPERALRWRGWLTSRTDNIMHCHALMLGFNMSQLIHA